MNRIGAVSPLSDTCNKVTTIYPSWPEFAFKAHMQIVSSSSAIAVQALQHVVGRGSKCLKDFTLTERRDVIRRFASMLEATDEQLSAWSYFYGVSPQLLTGFLAQARQIALNIANAECGVTEESAGGATLILFPANDPRNVAYFLPCLMLAGTGLIGKASSREPSVVTWAAQKAIEAGYPADALFVFSDLEVGLSEFISLAFDKCHTTVYMGSRQRGLNLFGESSSTVLFCAANSYAVIPEANDVEAGMTQLIEALHWPRDCVSVKNVFVPLKSLETAVRTFNASLSDLGGCVPPEMECAPRWAMGEPTDFEAFKQVVNTTMIAGGGQVLFPTGAGEHGPGTPIGIAYNPQVRSVHPLLFAGPSQRLIGICPVEGEGETVLEWVEHLWSRSSVELPMAAAVYGECSAIAGKYRLAHELHFNTNPINMWEKSVWHQGIDLPGKICQNARPLRNH